MRRGRIFVVALVATLAVVPAAQARRAATPVERQAMAVAAGIPAQCAVAVVSTVDQGYGSVRASDTVGCPESGGYSAVRRTGAAWEEVGVISKDVTARCPDDVPVRAAHDLLLCRRPVTSLSCRSLKVRPTRCAAGSVSLRGLRWRGWGSANAFARGVQRGKGAVRVRAYRPRACPSGDRVYTRLKTRTSRGVKVTRLPRPCPA